MKILLLVICLVGYDIALAQRVEFKGNIISGESGNTLENAAINFNNVGVYSNVDGNFKLIISIGGLIRISHIGFVTLNIASDTLASGKDYRLLLMPIATELREVSINASRITISAKEIVTNAIKKLPTLLDRNEFALEAIYRQAHYSIAPSTDTKKYTNYSDAAVFLHHPSMASTYQPIIKEVRRSNDLRYSSYNNVKPASILKEEQRLELSKGFLELDYARDRKPLKTDNDFWNPNPILCRLDSKFIKAHEFKLDSIISLDGKDVFVVRVLPSNKSVKIKTYLGVSPYIPDGLLLITDEDFHILEFHYAYVKDQSKSNSHFSNRLLEFVNQGEYLFRDVVKYHMYKDKLYLSYLMRETKDNTYMGGINESEFMESKPDEEDAYRYNRLKRELIVSKINTDVKNSGTTYLTS